MLVCGWTSSFIDKISLSPAYLVYRMTGIQGFSKYTAVKSNYMAEIIRKEK